jgi:transposase
VADQRKDGLHKLTTRLASEYGTIVIEDLHVAGRVIVADRWFASGKTCSGCGAVKAKLLLSERTYACAACGLVADRDANAARNLAEYGKRQVAGSGPETLNGRGADRQTPPGCRWL